MVNLDRLEEIKSLTLNSCFDRVQTDVTISPCLFNNLFNALSGISALNRVILANRVAVGGEEEVVLSEPIIGDFHSAIVALSNFSINALDDVIEKQEKKKNRS